jgi:hypothetical protein
MSENLDVRYTLDFGRKPAEQVPLTTKTPIPRIARLLALAIRVDGLIRHKAIRDYAEVARRGWVTRARMTQIMKLLNLAPDIQEAILFLPPLRGLNERNMRPVAREIDWDKQRRLFQEIARSPEAPGRPLPSMVIPCHRVGCSSPASKRSIRAGRGA